MPTKSERISDLMRHLMNKAANEESVTVGHVLEVFGIRGFAFLLLILALLNIFIFMVPFISILFGIPMIILAAQMILGIATPIFPHFILERTIKREALIKGLEQSIRGVEIIEAYIKPRLFVLSGPHLDRVHGLLVLMLAVMVALPIPVINIPPSIALVFLAIGMLQRDGLFIILAYAVAIWCFWLFKSLGKLAQALTR